MIKLDAKTLRVTEADEEHKKLLKKNPVYIIVDNVLDTYNIGPIFRLADAVAVTKVFLCGDTETPPNHRIKKASINTTEWVDWEYSQTTLDSIKKLRADVPGIQIVSVELDKRSVPYDSVEYTFPIALVIGHETTGVSEEVLQASDVIAEMPMWGVNISLNVMVSLGIMLYEVMKHAPKE
jgi:23S rRNA (guanosine2251-2'-O)-methyltransferase